MQEPKTLNALAQAVRDYDETILIPKQYLFALYCTQAFELQLRLLLKGLVQITKLSLSSSRLDYEPVFDDSWTAYKYIERIKVFLSQENYPDFYRYVNKAIKARNSFIHDSFKVRNGELVLVNLDLDKFYLHPLAKEAMTNWIIAFKGASREVTKIIQSKLNGIKLAKL